MWRKWRQNIEKSPENTLTWRHIGLTVAAFVYAAIAMFFVCMANSVADRLNTNSHATGSNKIRLLDPLMDSTNPFFENEHLPKNLPDSLLIMAFISFFIRLVSFPSLLATVVVIRRILFIVVSIYLLRACTVMLTVLPNPETVCATYPDPNLWLDTWHLYVMKRTSCGDVFFSGHTIIFTSSAVIWFTYSRNRYLRVLFCAAAAVGMLSLIMSTYHYTIDVLVGLWVTVSVWSLYHWALIIPAFRKRYWGRFICYIDGAPGMVGSLYRRPRDVDIHPKDDFSSDQDHTVYHESNLDQVNQMELGMVAAYGTRSSSHSSKKSYHSVSHVSDDDDADILAGLDEHETVPVDATQVEPADVVLVPTEPTPAPAEIPEENTSQEP